MWGGAKRAIRPERLLPVHGARPAPEAHIMPLQNRVTPLGDIVAAAERGGFTGNRGIIHDPETRTLLGRRWASQAWLICVLDWGGGSL